MEIRYTNDLDEYREYRKNLLDGTMAYEYMLFYEQPDELLLERNDVDMFISMDEFDPAQYFIK